jgi:hypothetical protein
MDHSEGLSKWKGDSDLNGLEMDHIDHRRGTDHTGRRDTDLDSSGNVTRSVWDGD